VRLWKIIGVAGVVGIVATGVLVARSRRSWSDTDVEEIREHLRARFAAAGRAGTAAG
jgi:hypothetical protein